MALKLLLQILGWLALLATTIPLLREEAWWIRIFDFPRVQVAVLSIGVLIGLLIMWDGLSLVGRSTAFLLVLAAFYQGYRIMPYTGLAEVQVPTCETGIDAANQFKLVTANVLMSNRDSNALLSMLRSRDADVVLLVETDTWWEESLKILDEHYPHQVRHPLDNTYGMLLYSKLPLGDSEVQFLIEDDVPSIWTEVTLRSGAKIKLVGLHPRPPRPDKDQDSTSRDAELVVAAKKVRSCTTPAIVTGDLNDVAWSYTTHLFQRISQLGDPRQGRGFFNSFHAGYWFLRYPLDHVFSSEEFQLVDMQRLDAFGSDHFPIFAHFCLVGYNSVDIPDASPGDLEKAERKERKAKDNEEADAPSVE